LAKQFDGSVGFLRDWIMQRSPLPAIKDELLIKLFAGHTVPTEAIRTLMQDHPVPGKFGNLPYDRAYLFRKSG
jgi:hypothetical protein